MDKSNESLRNEPSLTEDAPVVQHQGLVIELDSGAGGGRVETTDGRQLPFDRADLHGGLDGLRVGDQVVFAEEQGEQGPQAKKIQRGVVQTAEGDLGGEREAQ